MRHEFIPTKSFQDFQALCDDLINFRIGVEMACVVGKAGLGKTTAAQRMHTVNGTAAYVRYVEWMTPPALIREICFALTGTRPRSAQRCFDAIRQELSRTQRLIMVDEVDRASIRHLNLLRDFHDVAKVGVILIGEEGLLGKISQEARLENRARRNVFFQPVEVLDVQAFYEKALGVSLSSTQAARLTRHASGVFRSVVKTALAIERSMHATGVSEVTEEIMAKVCG